MQLDVNALGDMIAELIADAVEPLIKEIATLRASQPPQGERGEKGEPGKDAEPLDASAVADEVIAKLLESDRLETLATLKAAEAVAEHFAANPVQHGKDGERGERGEPGEKGADGKDGVGLAGAIIDRSGSLVVTLTDGSTKELGVVVGNDGRNGQDGKDGLSMAEVSRSYDHESHEVIERWTVGGEAKELRYPAGGIRPGGFWREGMKAFALQAVTHDGALWIAKRDTASKPCLENADDWQLAARKGRDGRDGKDGKPPAEFVRLGDGD